MSTLGRTYAIDFSCFTLVNRFYALYCHMGTAMKHPVPQRVKPSFAIFDIRALWRLGLSAKVPWCQKLQMTA